MTNLLFFYNQARFSDVTIAFGEKTIPAHAVILAQCPYFEALLASSMKETKGKDGIFIRLQTNEESFYTFLRFLYNGKRKRKGTIASLSGKEDFGPQDALKLLMDTRMFLDKDFITCLWDEYIEQLPAEIVETLDVQIVVDIIALGLECAVSGAHDSYYPTLLKIANKVPPVLSQEAIEWIVSSCSDEDALRIASVWMRRNPNGDHGRIVAKLPKKLAHCTIRTLLECSGDASAPFMAYTLDKLRIDSIGLPKHAKVKLLCPSDRKSHQVTAPKIQLPETWQMCVCGMALGTLHLLDGTFACKRCVDNEGLKERGPVDDEEEEEDEDVHAKEPVKIALVRRKEPWEKE